MAKRFHTEFGTGSVPLDPATRNHRHTKMADANEPQQNDATRPTVATVTDKTVGNIGEACWVETTVKMELTTSPCHTHPSVKETVAASITSEMGMDDIYKNL